MRHKTCIRSRKKTGLRFRFNHIQPRKILVFNLTLLSRRTPGWQGTSEYWFHTVRNESCWSLRRPSWRWPRRMLCPRQLRHTRIQQMTMPPHTSRYSATRATFILGANHLPIWMSQKNPLKNFAEFIYFSYLCGQITKKIRATVKDVKHILQTSLYVNALLDRVFL